MSRLPGLLGITGLALLILCASASAATRYAEPGGNGPAGSCPSSNPCDIQDAIEDASVVDGDKILLRGGEYALTGRLEAYDRLNIGGLRNAQPQLLFDQGGTTSDPAIDLHGDGTVLHDVFVHSRDSFDYVGLAIRTDAAVTIERVFAAASGAAGRAVELYAPNGGTTVLRDSFVYVGTSSVGIQAAGPSAPSAGHLRIVNVTAVAEATSPAALVASEQYGNYAIDVRNSILQTDGGDDFRVSSSSPGGSKVIATVVHSNFDTHSFADGTGDGTSLTLGAGNQSAVPLFTDSSAGDFTQAPGSPTINAGVAELDMGSKDAHGLPRSMGPRPDIGAFESIELCGGRTPTIFGTSRADRIRGTSHADVILALGGRDRVSALAGNDVVCGGDGNDVLRGGRGRDKLFGQKGRDTLSGGPAHDTLVGGAGRDTQHQ